MAAIDSAKKDTTSVKKKQSAFKIEFDYVSNTTYMGRRDTVNVPTFSPLLKYTTKNKFYFETAFVNVPGGATAFDEMNLGVGKLFRFTSNWDGNISYMHYFFNSNAARINAVIQSDWNFYTALDWDILYTQLMYDASKGNDQFKYKGITVGQSTSDKMMTIANSHLFLIDKIFRKDDDLLIMPELDILYGTQNFLSAFKGKIPPKDATKLKQEEDQAFQNQASQFGLTAYVVTLYVTYEVKRWSFAISPNYTIPENTPAGVSSTPYFVMAASVYYTIKSKK